MNVSVHIYTSHIRLGRQLLGNNKPCGRADTRDGTFNDRIRCILRRHASIRAHTQSDRRKAIQGSLLRTSHAPKPFQNIKNVTNKQRK